GAGPSAARRAPRACPPPAPAAARPRRALIPPPPPPDAADAHQPEPAGRHRELCPPLLSLRPRLGLGPHALQLCAPRPLLGLGPQAGHGRRHGTGIGWPVGPLGAEASTARGDPTWVGPAGDAPPEAVVELAARRQDAVLLGRVGHEWRATDQDHRQDRPQAEDIAPRVDLVDGADGLLGGHVPARPEHAAGLRRLRAVLVAIRADLG